MPSLQYKILIVEDEMLIAEDIAVLLENEGYKVTGICASANKALDSIEMNKPDLVLCDIRLKGSMDGVDLARRIRESYLIPFIFLTSMADDETIRRVKTTLPYAYLLKPFSRKELCTSIEIALSRHLAELERKNITTRRWNEHALRPLTQMESLMLDELLQGYDTAKMAERNYISVNTVKFHLRNIYSKLGTKNRIETLQLAIQILRQ